MSFYGKTKISIEFDLSINYAMYFTPSSPIPALYNFTSFKCLYLMEKLFWKKILFLRSI